MEDDDEPVGTVLSRRDAVRLAGAPALTWLAGCGMAGSDGDSTRSSPPPTSESDSPPSTPDESTADAAGTPAMTETTPPPEAETPVSTTATTPPGNMACVVRPVLAEGPFYSVGEDNPRRTDLRTDTSTGESKEGVRLDLELGVSEITEAGCDPLPGAIVDLWQADAHGVYSDVADAGTAGQDFLRGHQATDEAGRASFVTIYPGWYPGRTPHIHFKIRSPAEGGDATYTFTSQLFFTDRRSDAVYESSDPYRARQARETKNEQDTVYYGTDGATTLDLVETDTGFEATFRVGMYVD